MTEQRLGCAEAGGRVDTSRTVARNIVACSSKSILLQCNKLKPGLNFWPNPAADSDNQRTNQGAQMAERLPILLIPGLNCSARLYGEQIPALWRLGPVQIADHTRDDSMAAIAGRILADAPARFVLIGLSMGGYIAFEITRQAPE